MREVISVIIVMVLVSWMLFGYRFGWLPRLLGLFPVDLLS
jgi:hypothetical protein